MAVMKLRYAFQVICALCIFVIVIYMYGIKLHASTSSASRDVSTIMPKGYSCVVQKHPVSDEFQPVDDYNHTYVFSAYIDKMNEAKWSNASLIRIMAITQLNMSKTPPMRCVLVSREGFCEHVPARVQFIPEHHNFKYTAAFIFCDVLIQDIIHVSVISDASVNMTNIVMVNKEIPGPEVMFTNCVAPLHNYSNTYTLMEFISINQLLGSEKFVFYNYSTSWDVDSILKRLEERGIVEIIQWHIPENIVEDVNYFGQLLSTNDCMYRQRHISRFIVNTDLDEYIVPRNLKKWIFFLDEKLTKYPLTAVVYIRSFIFNTERDSFKPYNTKKLTAEKYKIMTLLKTNRTVLPMPPYIRQKLIYNPRRVDTVGVHQIWTVLPSFNVLWVAPDVCSLNHYRPFVSSYREGMSDTYVEDSYLHQIQENISVHLTDLWKTMPSYLIDEYIVNPEQFS